MGRAADNAYRLGLGLATLLMAIQTTEREADERRRARKQSVLAAKWAVLRTTFSEELAELQGYGGTGPSVRQLVGAFERATAAWPPGQRRALLIDLLMGDPFAPYELQVFMEDARRAVRTVALPLGLDETEIERSWQVWNHALAAYRSSRWRRPDHRLMNIPALTTDELVLPPPRADALAGGESAHALANDHNLALLSGGSLSARDAGMAAALWLAAAGGNAELKSPERRLLALPLASARNELVKVQMAHALIVEPGLSAEVTPSALLAALDHVHAQVDAQLGAERERNEDDAHRVRTIEELLSAVELTRDRIRQSQTAPAAAVADRTGGDLKVRPAVVDRL